MTANEVLTQFQKLGKESYRQTFLRHGAPESILGVSVGDMKKIQKKIKKDHALALELYDTGISDAMYFSALISEPQKMTKPQLQKWVKGATWHMLSYYTVPWVAAESRFGAELAREWIESKKELVASAGWSTWSSLVSIKPDSELDLTELEKLLDRVVKQIHGSPNLVRESMNCFIIAVGSYVTPLSFKAKATAKAVGKVEVDKGDTACKVPDAFAYIEMVEQKGRAGKKRKSAMC